MTPYSATAYYMLVIGTLLSARCFIPLISDRYCYVIVWTASRSSQACSMENRRQTRSLNISKYIFTFNIANQLLHWFALLATSGKGFPYSPYNPETIRARYGRLQETEDCWEEPLNPTVPKKRLEDPALSVQSFVLLAITSKPGLRNNHRVLFKSTKQSKWWVPSWPSLHDTTVEKHTSPYPTLSLATRRIFAAERGTGAYQPLLS